jgi:hypothetical protein
LDAIPGEFRDFSEAVRQLTTARRLVSTRTNALALVDATRLLAKTGGWPITVEMLRADVDASAPVNADGTINLVHYTAWLVKEMAGRD